MLYRSTAAESYNFLILLVYMSAEGQRPEKAKSQKRDVVKCFLRAKRIRSAEDFLNNCPWVVALIVVGVNGYFIYAFGWLAVWRRIEPRNRGAAIAILVLFSWLNAHLYISWAAIHIWGPGTITDDYERSGPNDAFLCDAQGYALYCFNCQRIKPARTHHTGHLDRCVPVMDHFCPWLAAVIGQGNLKFFLQFAWCVFLILTLMLVSLLIYEHGSHINGNIIALYILIGLSLGFVVPLIFQHIGYTLTGHTTIEHLALRENRLPHVNVPWINGERRVFNPAKTDISFPKPSMFYTGKWPNIREVMGPIWSWFIPIRPPIREPLFNQNFLDYALKQIQLEESAEKTNPDHNGEGP